MSSAPTAMRRFVPPRPFAGVRGLVEEIGLGVLTLWVCLRLYAGILLGRGQLDLPAFSAALRQAGLTMLLPMTLVSAAVGAILGRQTATILDDFNLPSLFLLSLSYAVVVELIPILTGILVAGRAGVALAVRHATLIGNGQMDGLLVCGIHPIEYLTAPVLLAMLLMSFAFTVWGSLITFIAAFLWLVWLAGVPPALFIDSLQTALTAADLVQALAKPLVFALVIALLATVNGTGAARNAEGIASAATRTMIGAVTAILFLDLVFVLWP